MTALGPRPLPPMHTVIPDLMVRCVDCHEGFFAGCRGALRCSGCQSIRVEQMRKDRALLAALEALVPTVPVS